MIQPSTMSSVSPSMSTSTSMTTTVSSTTCMCVSLLFLFCLFYNCCNLKLFNVKHLKVIIHIANLAHAVSIIGTNDIIITIGYYCVIILPVNEFNSYRYYQLCWNLIITNFAESILVMQPQDHVYM